MYFTLTNNEMDKCGHVSEESNFIYFLFFLISINQIDLCHTSNISSKGWFIHLFEKYKVKYKKKKKKK